MGILACPWSAWGCQISPFFSLPFPCSPLHTPFTHNRPCQEAVDRGFDVNTQVATVEGGKTLLHMAVEQVCVASPGVS